MSEAEWLAMAGSSNFLDRVWHLATQRKLVLFRCALWRTNSYFVRERLGQAIERHLEQLIGVAERRVDGMATEAELLAAIEALNTLRAEGIAKQDFEMCAYMHDASSVLQGCFEGLRPVNISDGTSFPVRYFQPTSAVRHLVAATANGPPDLLRDLFEDLFHVVTLDSSWITRNDATVPKLAQAIYDDRRFEDLPILADALMDAGCHDEAILAHCRSPGPHVRGCWVVDLLLAKQ
jgi:hypothetical protein